MQYHDRVLDNVCNHWPHIRRMSLRVMLTSNQTLFKSMCFEKRGHWASLDNQFARTGMDRKGLLHIPASLTPSHALSSYEAFARRPAYTRLFTQDYSALACKCHQHSSVLCFDCRSHYAAVHCFSPEHFCPTSSRASLLDAPLPHAQWCEEHSPLMQTRLKYL